MVPAPPTGQSVVYFTLLLTLVLFIWGRLRYDVVALLALLAVVGFGVVPPDRAFNGFGNPAVVTVAAVLVVTRALQNNGVVELLARAMAHAGSRPWAQVAAVTMLATAISGFVSSVAAAALLMPVAVRMTRRTQHSASILLMPLAFGSLLGALFTLIGSSPNIIVSEFRGRMVGEPFRMFDFSPVGGGIALAGVVFISLLGWRLIPRRQGQAAPDAMFDIQSYITEVRVPEDSPVVDGPLVEVERAVGSGAVTVAALVREERRLLAPSSFEVLRAGDTLIVEAGSEDLATLVDTLGLELVGKKDEGTAVLGSDDVVMSEAVVRPDSPVADRTASGLRLRDRYGVNLLAVARHGRRVPERLSRVRIRAGDVLLLQGPRETMAEAVGDLGCLPLAERGLRIGAPRRIVLSTAIFLLALVVAAMGWQPVHVAFVAAAVVLVVAGLVSLREAYASVDWPIVVLLGAMIPVGQALETTGGAARVADVLLRMADWTPAWGSVAVILVATMCLSDLINNAAAAVLMAPIAFGVAQGLQASPDPFLMAVAIGASCAFLTPIGHQSNTLVMGPGGYRFGDYWRLGLPLELLIAAVAVPLILRFWPLGP
jgi:di/tricarboxylate transporter